MYILYYIYICNIPKSLCMLEVIMPPWNRFCSNSTKSLNVLILSFVFSLFIVKKSTWLILQRTKEEEIIGGLN